SSGVLRQIKSLLETEYMAAILFTVDITKI
ncbi:hypothetical protein BHECKSOX_114, partial [Bathymodiolus heckerae thiotrophic gill symbiont]